MRRLLKKLARAVADYDPAYYDMHEDPEEAWFAQLYLERIERQLRDAGVTPPARLLEAGCQTGRLAIPLARRGFQVTGIDTSGFALRRARRHAREAGVEVAWRRGDIERLLAPSSPSTYDAVICAEVVYLSTRCQALLEAMARALHPGGLLCVSHRPRDYYVVEALRAGDPAAADAVLCSSDGPFRGSAYYNWQTPEQLQPLYETLGFERIVVYPIDRFAWLTRLRPSQLSSAQQAQWRQLEQRTPALPGLHGRYLLVTAIKSRAPHREGDCAASRMALAEPACP